MFRNWKTNSLITTKMKISSQLKPISKILSMCKNDQNQQVTEIKLYKLILWLILYLNKLQHNDIFTTHLILENDKRKRWSHGLK